MTKEETPSPKRSRLSERVSKLSPSGIRKFFDLIASMDDVISLGVGEPDFVTPWSVREAAIYSLEKGVTMYSSNYGLIELRQEISKYMERRFKVNYEPAQEVLVTVGVSEGLDLAMRAILDPGDEVIIPEPTYVSYIPCVTLAGGIPVTVPTNMENSFRVKPEDIEARITPKTKAILMGYPNNPTGSVMTRKDLIKISEIAERYDLTVVSDEVYERLVYDEEHVCFASLPNMASRTIHLGGFSKSYAMTGWRIGYAAGPKDIIKAIGKIQSQSTSNPSSISQAAAVEALNGKQDFIKKRSNAFKQRRDFVVKSLNNIKGISCLKPNGAFYVFPSCKGLLNKKTKLKTDTDFVQKLLEKSNVAVVQGSAFGLDGYFRISYATSMNNLKKAMYRIKSFCESLEKIILFLL